MNRLQQLFRNSLLSSILAFTIIGNVTVGTVATLSIVAVAPAVVYTACSKDQLVSAAEDVLSVVSDQSLQDALKTLSPSVLKEVLSAVPTARDLVAAIKKGDTSNALALINTIFPVIESAFTVLSAGNPSALAILAVANIALHFIINHVKSKAPSAAGRSSAVNAALAYGDRPAWGCQYRQDKCRKYAVD